MLSAACAQAGGIPAKDLRPGDIIIYEKTGNARTVDEDITRHQRLRSFSWLTSHGSATRKGSSCCIHTALVIEANDQSILLAHALNCGIALVRKSCNDVYERSETRHIFRCMGQAATAAIAASIAKGWIQHHPSATSRKEQLTDRLLMDSGGLPQQQAKQP